MIVKNESAVILRCLDSVRPLIDYVLIEDTGSSDGTQQLIRNWLAKEKIPGQVIDEPWQNFAHNRSHVLGKLRELPLVDYALIMDADDALIIEENLDVVLFKTDLDKDLYDVEIRHGSARFFRPQLCRNAMTFSYKAVLHEYLEGPEGPVTRATAAGLRIDTGRGGARNENPNKYRDDAAVLEKALTAEADPFLISRYRFYLAQSYRDCGEREKALDNYLLRAELGYWDEEIFESLYAVAILKEELAYPADEVIASYLKAADIVPTRAEALHGVARFCRLRGRCQEGVHYARRGMRIPMPGGGLFIQRWIYDYGLADEFAISAYWVGDYRDSLDTCLNLLANPLLPESERIRVGANARFAADKLPRPANLGVLGRTSQLDLHAITADRPLRTHVTTMPKILLAILAKQKAKALPLYLACIEALDYPKSDIVLYVRTNNNTDDTHDILRAWLSRVGDLYAAVEYDASDVSEPVENFAEHEWNAQRFLVLGQIRQTSLQRALHHQCAFYFVSDVDNFIRSSTLKELVALNLPIVAPLLRSIDAGSYYSNYHAEIDENGYYRECDQYHWILNGYIRGVNEVPVVHCTYLIRSDVIPDLAYADKTERHEYVIFSESARKAGIPQYLDNRQTYGYITFAIGEASDASSEFSRASRLLGINPPLAEPVPASLHTGQSDDPSNIDKPPGSVEHQSVIAPGQLSEWLQAFRTKADPVTVFVHPDMAGFVDHLAEILVQGVEELGARAVLVRDLPPVMPDPLIVIGANLLTDNERARLSDCTIILNVENSASSFMTDAYLRCLARTIVWDYDSQNSASLSIILEKPVFYFRLFYVPSLSRSVFTPEKDIDVLFYGSFNERREKIMDGLRKRGLAVGAVFNVFSTDLDSLIARSKVVINIHYYDNGRFEIVRLSDLFANRCAVISEVNLGERIDEDLKGAFIGVPYDALVETTEALVRDDNKRRQVAEEGFRLFSQRRAVDILPEALAWAASQSIEADDIRR
ncbi:glycosyltransferase [Acidisoma silvae]|uniref:Glycosyltransferase n=1 Tax=Acidisoma silvae TaxID=2802396 RepID=A0A964E171_9PROT|nr:glycosyltransferase [Acidisoma silvae]MCB8877473.1 glycosyltransferase [Acidisoma silvae]